MVDIFINQIDLVNASPSVRQLIWLPRRSMGISTRRGRMTDLLIMRNRLITRKMARPITSVTIFRRGSGIHPLSMIFSCFSTRFFCLPSQLLLSNIELWDEVPSPSQSQHCTGSEVNSTPSLQTKAPEQSSRSEPWTWSIPEPTISVCRGIWYPAREADNTQSSDVGIQAMP